MIVFSDTDIIIKLASLDLLDETLAILDADPSTVYVLSLEQARLGAPDIIADYGKEASDRAVAFAKNARKITKPDRAEFINLIQIIDPGEATLFAATACMPFDNVITGDRKALAKLSRDPRAHATVRRVAGKVVCLEQLLLDIISQYGFELVRTRMLKSSIPDAALVRIFKEGSQASELDVRRQLRERVNNIRGTTGVLLSEFFGT